MAKKIQMRMKILRQAPDLSSVPAEPPMRRHQLGANREGQFAVDLKHPYRLIFEPAHEPVPRKADEGVDLSEVTRIRIIGVEDYH